jgi:hypothetical protein
MSDDDKIALWKRARDAFDFVVCRLDVPAVVARVRMDYSYRNAVEAQFDFRPQCAPRR